MNECQERFHEGIVPPTALYGAESWNMGAERNRLNVRVLRCLIGMNGITLMDQVKNEEVRRRIGLVKELGDQAEKGIL